MTIKERVELLVKLILYGEVTIIKSLNTKELNGTTIQTISIDELVAYETEGEEE